MSDSLPLQGVVHTLRRLASRVSKLDSLIMVATASVQYELVEFLAALLLVYLTLLVCRW